MSVAFGVHFTPATVTLENGTVFLRNGATMTMVRCRLGEAQVGVTVGRLVSDSNFPQGSEAPEILSVTPVANVSTLRPPLNPAMAERALEWCSEGALPIPMELSFYRSYELGGRAHACARVFAKATEARAGSLSATAKCGRLTLESTFPIDDSVDALVQELCRAHAYEFDQRDLIHTYGSMMVFLIGKDLCGVDAALGDIVWRTPVPEVFDHCASFVKDDLVLFQDGDEGVFLHTRSGEVVVACEVLMTAPCNVIFTEDTHAFLTYENETGLRSVCEILKSPSRKHLLVWDRGVEQTLLLFDTDLNLLWSIKSMFGDNRHGFSEDGSGVFCAVGRHGHDETFAFFDTRTGVEVARQTLSAKTVISVHMGSGRLLARGFTVNMIDIHDGGDVSVQTKLAQAQVSAAYFERENVIVIFECAREHFEYYISGRRWGAVEPLWEVRLRAPDVFTRPPHPPRLKVLHGTTLAYFFFNKRYHVIDVRTGHTVWERRCTESGMCTPSHEEPAVQVTAVAIAQVPTHSHLCIDNGRIDIAALTSPILTQVGSDIVLFPAMRVTGGTLHIDDAWTIMHKEAERRLLG